MRGVTSNLPLVVACIATVTLLSGAAEVSAERLLEAPPPECRWFSSRFDAAQVECDLRECSDLAPDADERASSSKHNARCAVRYDELLEITDKCHLDPNSEKLFDVLMNTLDLWEAAYACMPDLAHSLYLEEALDLIDREAGSRRKGGDPAHLEQIEARRERIVRIEAPLPELSPSPPPAGSSSSITPITSTPASSHTVEVRPLLDMFTIRVAVGTGRVFSLLETVVDERSEFTGRLAVAGSISAGTRISFADFGSTFTGAMRHFVDVGLAYTALGGRLTLSRGSDPYGLAGAALRWVHHVGGFARYGYRAHAEHASLYIEAGAGLQVFTMGGNFGTPFGRGGLGVCTLWEFLCVDAGYVHGWRGALPREQETGFANAARVTVGVDLLRIPELTRGRRERRERP